MATVSGLGHRDVWSYVNSGNVIFEVDGPGHGLEDELQRAFEAVLGFEATTFVRRQAELADALAVDPFPVNDGDTYFITFLKDPLDREGRIALEALSNDFDTVVVVGRDVHWRMHGRSLDTRLRARDWETIVGRHRSTSRNTTMLRKLMAKAASKS